MDSRFGGIIASLTISGVPYSLRSVPEGYGIVANDKPQDHFYRSYFVRADSHGMPLSCSCPHCHTKKAWCKHLRAVTEWWISNTLEGQTYSKELEDAARLRGLYG